MGELIAVVPLCFGTYQMEHVELEEFDISYPEGKGSSVFQISEILSAAEAELKREAGDRWLLLVQCRSDPDSLLSLAPVPWYLSTILVHTYDTTCCTLHQKSSCPKGF